MNAYSYKENSKTPLLFSVMIALAALLMIYWVLNIANAVSVPLPLSYSSAPAAQADLATPAERPSPLPVPTPPADQGQAPAGPLSTPAAPVAPQPQPVALRRRRWSYGFILVCGRWCKRPVLSRLVLARWWCKLAGAGSQYSPA